MLWQPGWKRLLPSGWKRWSELHYLVSLLLSSDETPHSPLASYNTTLASHWVKLVPLGASQQLKGQKAEFLGGNWASIYFVLISRPERFIAQKCQALLDTSLLRGRAGFGWMFLLMAFGVVLWLASPGSSLRYIKKKETYRVCCYVQRHITRFQESLTSLHISVCLYLFHI